jgi:hypothetical protein
VKLVFRINHLYNEHIMSAHDTSDVPIASPASRLSLLKRERFRAETREERTARSLAALNKAPLLRLSPQQWKEAADSPEFEEEA